MITASEKMPCLTLTYNSLPPRVSHVHLLALLTAPWRSPPKAGQPGQASAWKAESRMRSQSPGWDQGILYLEHKRRPASECTHTGHEAQKIVFVKAGMKAKATASPQSEGKREQDGLREGGRTCAPT